MINLETYFLDTSAILNGALNYYKHVYISPITLIELEKIKNASDKNEEIKYKARHATKDICGSLFIQITSFPQSKINKIIKKNNFLLDINDHHILAAAELLGIQNDEIVFVTSDYAQYLFAMRL